MDDEYINSLSNEELKDLYEDIEADYWISQYEEWIMV